MRLTAPDMQPGYSWYSTFKYFQFVCHHIKCIPISQKRRSNVSSLYIVCGCFSDASKERTLVSSSVRFERWILKAVALQKHLHICTEKIAFYHKKNHRLTALRIRYSPIFHRYHKIWIVFSNLICIKPLNSSSVKRLCL